MQTAVKQGRRWFAVPKSVGLADRIAMRSNVKGNWDQIERAPKGSRVIINHHR